MVRSPEATPQNQSLDLEMPVKPALDPGESVFDDGDESSIDENEENEDMIAAILDDDKPRSARFGWDARFGVQKQGSTLCPDDTFPVVKVLPKKLQVLA